MPASVGCAEVTAGRFDGELVEAVLGAAGHRMLRRRKGPAGLRELDLLLHSAGATVVSFDADQVLLARSAYEKYGKGHHPAALNLGDCCSYALSRSSGEPLLFKGNDFSRTDVTMVDRSHSQ